MAGATDLASTGAATLEARAVCNEIALNTTNLGSTQDQIFSNSTDAGRTDQQTRADQHVDQDAFIARTDTSADTRTANLGDALAKGDSVALKASFQSIMSGGNPTTTRGGNQPNPNQGTQGQQQQGLVQQGQGMFGNAMLTRRGDGPGTGTGPGVTPQPQQPIFPGATGRLATLTPNQMQAFAKANPQQPGQPRTPLQQAFDRLQRACNEGNHEEASQILSQHPELAEALESGTTRETRDSDEVTDTDGDSDTTETGEGGRTGRSDGDGAGRQTRVARTFSPDEHLQQGIMDFSGRGGREGGGSGSTIGGLLARLCAVI